MNELKDTEKETELEDVTTCTVEDLAEEDDTEATDVVDDNAPAEYEVEDD